MNRFKQHLVENALYLIEEIKSNDDKGKLHELLVAKHLSSSGDLPKHYRNEDTQKTPAQTHDDIKSRIAPEDYDEANKRAKEAAEHIKSHLKEHHQIESHHIKEVAWTSNKSDHKKFTGSEDPNSDADVMIHTHNDAGKDYHGISLKVGASQPNLRNPGLKTLDHLTSADSEKTKAILAKHRENLNKIGYNTDIPQHVNHAQYKKDRDGENPEKAKAADKSKLEALNHLAKHYAESINNQSPEHTKRLMSSLIAPKTHYNHIRVHTKTPATGKSGETSHHVENHQADLENELAKHNHGFHAVSSRQVLHVHAKHEDGSVGKRLMSIGMKGMSGPIKGMVAATTSHIHKGLNEELELADNINDLLEEVLQDELAESKKSFDKVMSDKLLETSSRLKTKFIRMAEPRAKAQGFVGHATGNQDDMDKADRTLKTVQKVKNRLDLHGIQKEEIDLEESLSAVLEEPKS